MTLRKFIVVVDGKDIAGDFVFDDKITKFAGFAYILEHGSKVIEVDPNLEIELGDKYVG
jgi:hypothetical protein